MRIGIVGAMNEEISLICNKLEKLKKIVEHNIDISFGKINDNEIYIISSGVGKVNASVATSMLILNFNCELIINTGVAGGINDTNTKDVILATGLVQSDFDISIFGREKGEIPGFNKILKPNDEDIKLIENVLNDLNIKYKKGIILTQDRFVTGYDMFENVDGSLATEMEGASVAQTAIKLNTRFIILRYISDVVGKEKQIENYDLFESEMSHLSSIITLNILNSLGNKKNNKYYAIKADDYQNIVSSWDEAKEIISKLSNPKYKSFLNLAEAKAFINDEIYKGEDDYEWMSYVDGSFDKDKNKYSYGGILIHNGEVIESFNKSFNDDFIIHHNVAGEVRGASYVINHAIKKGIKELHLYFDYEGISKFYSGLWKPKTELGMKYQEFAEEAKKKINVIFHKVKSHSNNYYNDLVDKLAKDALNK
jgi:5'-methylthioadenosine/S-adenosylhomocysteine nucleosidase